MFGNDPAGSWLSYAAYTAPGKITALNMSWVVPNNPSSSFGSNAPGWWFGIQTAKGDGALIQPILAYGYKGNFYSIFNACFDWTDGSWHTSPETYTVEPGDIIDSSITYKNDGSNSYDMYIHSKNTGKSITTNYKLESGQTSEETVGYIVLEHQPLFCSAYPADGVCTFTDIKVEVEGKLVENASWTAFQEQPKCDSKATILNSSAVQFTWNAKK
jgi:hypothetical protein